MTWILFNLISPSQQSAWAISSVESQKGVLNKGQVVNVTALKCNNVLLAVK